MTAIMRRKRLADGTFGDMEKVFSGETADEKVARLQEEKEAQDKRLIMLEGALFELMQEIL